MTGHYRERGVVFKVALAGASSPSRAVSGRPAVALTCGEAGGWDRGWFDEVRAARQRS